MKISGIQKLNKDQIELKASVFLEYYNENYFKYARCTPLLQIADFLKNKHNITFDFDGRLLFSKSNSKILGCFYPNKRVIVIDGSIANDQNKFNFTLAHELGHLSLHRNLVFEESDVENSYSDTDRENDLSFGKKDLKTDIDWMEWQANYFASCLLMPKNIFFTVVVNFGKKHGSLRANRIYLDEQPCNQKSYYELIQDLSLFFKVSNSAIRYRMEDLRLVNENKRNSPKSAYELMNEYLKENFKK